MAGTQTWRSSAGFVLAAIGSAVGLGNLWRFAYLASTGGGAAFVVLYLLVVVFVGVPLLLAELAMGRGTSQGALLAPAAVGGPRFRWLGGMFVATGFLILAYYAVIMGWTLRYVADTALGLVPADTGRWFGEVATGPAAVAWHVLGMAMTVAIVAGGLRGGIERAGIVLMPVLFVLIAALAIWAATIPGGEAGYAFYLRPRADEVFHLGTLTRAVGQAFFSLSLGMGAMLTYASYLPRGGNLVRQGFVIAFSDTAVAIVGGLVTFPIVHAFGLASTVGESSVGALFIALPAGFNALGPVTGRVVGVAFFVTLFIAAITSAISLLEVVVAGATARLGWSRRRAAVLAGAAITLAGVPAALDLGWLGVLDQVAGNVMLVLGGLVLSLLAGWSWRDATAELADGFPHPRAARVWLWLLRVFVPALLVPVGFVAVQGAVEAIRAFL